MCFIYLNLTCGWTGRGNRKERGGVIVSGRKYCHVCTGATGNPPQPPLPPAPCAASHSQMETHHTTAHAKTGESIKKLVSQEMTAAAERENSGAPSLNTPHPPSTLHRCSVSLQAAWFALRWKSERRRVYGWSLPPVQQPLCFMCWAQRFIFRTHSFLRNIGPSHRSQHVPHETVEVVLSLDRFKTAEQDWFCRNEHVLPLDQSIWKLRSSGCCESPFTSWNIHSAVGTQSELLSSVQTKYTTGLKWPLSYSE